MGKKLFRMTTKRKIILESIITTINLKIDNVDEDSIRRELLLDIDNPLPQIEKEEKLKELDNELNELSVIHDVLEVVICHGDNTFKIMRTNEKWENEWDVPLEVFNKSIDTTIDILKFYRDRNDEKYQKSYDKKIKFLLELKDFRNK